MSEQPGAGGSLLVWFGVWTASFRIITKIEVLQALTKNDSYQGTPTLNAPRITKAPPHVKPLWVFGCIFGL